MKSLLKFSLSLFTLFAIGFFVYSLLVTSTGYECITCPYNENMVLDSDFMFLSASLSASLICVGFLLPIILVIGLVFFVLPSVKNDMEKTPMNDNETYIDQYYE